MIIHQFLLWRSETRYCRSPHSNTRSRFGPYAACDSYVTSVFSLREKVATPWVANVFSVSLYIEVGALVGLYNEYQFIVRTCLTKNPESTRVKLKDGVVNRLVFFKARRSAWYLCFLKTQTGTQEGPAMIKKEAQYVGWDREGIHIEQMAVVIKVSYFGARHVLGMCFFVHPRRNRRRRKTMLRPEINLDEEFLVNRLYTEDQNIVSFVELHCCS